MAAKTSGKTKTLLDEGFGFPVLLIGVSVVTIRGVETPDINYRAYARLVMEALAYKPARLTGNEIRFARLECELTLKEFAKRFGQGSHQAVMKWEGHGNRATAMGWTVEKDIRLFILDHLGVGTKKFFRLYVDLVDQRPVLKEPLKIDARKIAA